MPFKKKNKKLGILLLLGLCALMPRPAPADIPETINYQGYLTGQNGSPLHGEFPMTFRLYDQSANGVLLWEESRNVTPIFGIVDVTLGEFTPFPPDVLFDRPYFLGVQVGTDEEMTPRITLGAAGYAFRSRHMDNPSNPGGWTDSGAAVSLTTDNDRVGIGTAAPEEKLHVQGTGVIQGIFESTGSSGGIQLTATDPDTKAQQKYELQSLTNGNFIIFNRTDPSINFGYYLEIDTNGNTGIGTRTPTSRLDVNGEVRTRGSLVFSDSAGNPFPDNWIGMADNIDGDSRWLHIGGITDGGVRRIALIADHSHLNGWVGIGENRTSPGERVDVSGNIKIIGAGNGIIFPDGTRQTISPTNGNGGFPAPAFDSGWNYIAPGSSFTLTHDLGGEVNNYKVDLQMKNQQFQSIGNFGFGGDSINGRRETGGPIKEEYFLYTGMSYCCLNQNNITVTREPDDPEHDYFRVRIWTYN